jgi:UDP-glucose 4-epimerase
MSLKILVTGGAGFIASHVTDAYIQLGHRVTVADNLSSGRRPNLHPKARFFKTDIRAAALKRLILKNKFDVVNHHAAQIDVRKSVADPAHDAQVNILGLLNILEGARAARVKKVIMAASGGTYYGECPRAAVETDRPEPLSPYGITKLAGEIYLRAYRALHGLRYTVLRYGNVYGPRQDPHGEAGVVAIFCQRMLAGEPLSIFGNGKQMRDYVFVKDVARASVRALAAGHDDAFNIGTSQPASVNDLFRHLKNLTGYGLKAVYKPARPGELFRSCLNVNKAARGLGWKPQYSLVEGLAETALFFKELKAGTIKR